MLKTRFVVSLKYAKETQSREKFFSPPFETSTCARCVSKGLRRKEGSRHPWVYARCSYINHVVGVGQYGLSSEGWNF